MIELIWDSKFKKSYKKKISFNLELKEKFRDSIIEFSNNPFSSNLRTHKLKGKLEGLWAFSISYDVRIIFKFLDSEKALLIDIGKHDDIY
jgi:addiction module RelE/StbE family toxin